MLTSKLIVSLLFSIICSKLVTALPTKTSLITFDDLINSTSTEGVQIPANYFGLNWLNVLVLNGVDYVVPHSGYLAGVVSPKYVAFNGYGQPMRISSVDMKPFTIESFYSCAAWYDHLSVVLLGQRSGTVLFSKTVQLLTQQKTFIQLNWSGIDTISFNASCDAKCDATHMTIDNLSISL